MNSGPLPNRDEASRSTLAAPQTIIVQAVPRRRWLMWLLIPSLLINLIMLALFITAYLDVDQPPHETYHSGTRLSDHKIALLQISGTIMPPFTARILGTIDRIEKDDDVACVILSIDSPGGFVADSHQIYHRLQQLSKQKPVHISMKRLAASGGYYVAMGAGPGAKIYVEPTTWTGSIGVIIPRYNVVELADKVGVEADPLITGRFKDSLSPFREMTDEEREVWQDVMDDAFNRFKGVIVDNRPEMDLADVEAVATGRIFTAEQAIENGLVDEIAFEDEVIETLAGELGFDDYQVVTYQWPTTLADMLLGSAQAQQPASPWQTLLDASVPRAMYFCGWTAGMNTQQY